ncbi:hypothetical protein OIDMADRAFT_144166 [Oidiodendron maius Zn]|uniref:Uncharacterized protein n=1 Tax=Oidiodendron maius (strain Zn) TaxID=913774 RepID=A0A0C3CVV5_OIDMZ|nr:hypothetical protein OIDMADRAFT_144166 [Oidiodendron maius Zn]
MSQQTSHKAFTKPVILIQPRDPSHHGPSSKGDKTIHTFTSNASYTVQTNQGNFDQKTDMPSYAIEYHDNRASSIENALLHIGSQFEEAKSIMVADAADEEYVPPAGSTDYSNTTSEASERGPIERYLFQTVDEDPWTMEDSSWEIDHQTAEDKGLSLRTSTLRPMY